jgi:hypothetical protein
MEDVFQDERVIKSNNIDLTPKNTTTPPLFKALFCGNRLFMPIQKEKVIVG